jgi:elongation factor G
MEAIGKGARAIALVGPAGAGKTSLSEALLQASGAIPRLGSVETGTSVGDASPEARSRGASTELNLSRFRWGNDDYVLLDAPGSLGFAAEAGRALDVADLALVVITPEPERAPLVEPLLRELEDRKVPHAVFVNRIDRAQGTIEDLLEALQPLSSAALVVRQIPLSKGEEIVGFVDLALDRAYRYRPGKPSEQQSLPPEMLSAETAARFHLLEQLSDHDDDLLEQLLGDQEPDLSIVFHDLQRETEQGLIVPVMFGSAINGFGIRRLLKTLRHDTPPPALTAERLGIHSPVVEVFKVCNDTPVGRLALGRVFGASLPQGAQLSSAPALAQRAGALFAMQGGATIRIEQAEPGDVIGIAKAEALKRGDRLGLGGVPPAQPAPRRQPNANYSLAIAVEDQRDEVRLATSLNKLVEDDPGLSWETIDETRETLLRGMDEEHLGLAIDRLKRRYGLKLTTREPSLPLRETVRKSSIQRGRHKKQTGGHGQYGDVVIEVRPLPRGDGFRFEDRISGGVVPRQWIPAVEQGVKDALGKGPLGCPVVDVAVTLLDGSYHSVDSSELAFRTAGRIAATAALADGVPYLLEPVDQLTIHSPGSATSRVTSAVAGCRGRVLDLYPRQGWSRWDTIEAQVPEAELRSFQRDLRSFSQGMARFEARFDHLAEVTGKVAEAMMLRTSEAA